MSLVRTEEASLRAAEGSAAQCWGGRASAGHTGQVSWDVSLQRWDSHPSTGQGRPSPCGAGVPSSELPRSQSKLLAAGGWGGGGEQGQALVGARPFPQPGTGLSASSGFRFLDKELVVGSSPG